MTIHFSDLTDDEQTEVVRWEEEVLPPRITGLQASVVSLQETNVALQLVEDIFKKIYDSFGTNIMRNGFLSEIASLMGDSFSFIVDDAAIAAAASDPRTSSLFSSTTFLIDPLFEDELRADVLSGDFDINQPAYTGAPPASTPTGYNERAALVVEQTEWLKPGPPAPLPPAGADPAIIYDMWLAEEAALLNQLTALTILNANVDLTEPGKTNVGTAITDVTTELAIIQGYIAAFPGLPVEATRLAEIAARIIVIDARVVQVRDTATGDMLTYRDERYFWIRKRINLSYGSLRRIESNNQTITDLNAQIADIQQELQFYLDFRP